MQELDITNAQRERVLGNIVGKYGIDYLDDFLLGIRKKELILIGADPGVGKTEIASYIAHTNAEAGLRVHMLALEADEYEISIRGMYKFYASHFFADILRDPNTHFNYRNYILGQIDLSKYDEAVRTEYFAKYKTLTVHYRDTSEVTLDNDSFDLTKLVQIIGLIKDDCDMMVIDHLHYFDLDETKPENSELTNIMKTIRRMNLMHKFPIIAIAHLRKKTDKRQIIPDNDSYMGTSNIPKIAKTNIVFSKDYEHQFDKQYLFGTFCRVLKARAGGASNMLARLWFDSKLSRYRNSYDLCRVDYFGHKITDIDLLAIPDWAKNCKKLDIAALTAPPF
jgi:replicative DNA helicase